MDAWKHAVWWGKIDYKGKTVLDLGADIGSTADFFLRKGAKKVVAVEGSQDNFRTLQTNASILKGMIPNVLFIERPSQIEKLILQYDFDIVKMDIEGGEINLFTVKNEIFSKVAEYIVEVHSDKLFDLMLKKCAENNYKIISAKAWSPPVRIIYVRKCQKRVRKRFFLF